MAAASGDPLALFRPAVRAWFEASFAEPTPAQARGWPPIARGESTLLLAPTGSGKTLAAFLCCIDRLLFEPLPPRADRCRVLYVSPLKALAVDVERNLRAPLAGIRAVAERRGDACTPLAIALRTGDTPPRERARFRRAPSDLLITTPESLYLLLTSSSRDALRAVETVIVDEIHALVPGKRGAHLAVSIERLETLAGRRLQRIGLSATQRPLDEVARFLGGAEPGPAPRTERARGGARSARVAAREIHDEFEEGGGGVRHRPVTIVDAGIRKPLELTIEVPVEDMARPARPARASRTAGPAAPSIWSAIQPRLLERIREHRSTLVFVNSRRLAERLAAALDDLAGEPIAFAHHGSIAREQRAEIEARLVRGEIRALVATSSLELGIDIGAIDLVVQIEAPPSVASGLQRIGRSGHRVGAPSRGILYPKYRADLVACAALAAAMHEAAVEPVRYPRNPLDVLAQQIVAMTSLEPWTEDELFGLVRRAAPFARLSRASFESVLDMLSGRWASDDFATLQPRINWNRATGAIEARSGARRIAVTSGGTIPDRGLYGVFLAGAPKSQARVGELDEEMVFESRPGDTFVLGASTWRIEEITNDRVVVSPAPGQPGRMPFWRGDGAGRSVGLGRRIGALVRELRELPRAAALARLERDHDLDPLAAENLLRYLDDQHEATGAVPDDRSVVIERIRDDLGDWRVCVLSPLGGRVLAPWAMAAVAKIREQAGIDAEAQWTDDGFVVRLPETDSPPDASLLLPGPDEVERLVIDQLGSSALFAARFREVASRALLLPRRRPGRRSPLWHQRKRAQDLLSVAARFGSFPMLLETTRECLREVFDLPALREVLGGVAAGEIDARVCDPSAPSPFASAILFGFVASYIYEGDVPIAERRAQALAIDHAQLRELLGEAELRELLDAGALAALERELQGLGDAPRPRDADGVHGLLLRLGDLSREALRARCAPGAADDALPGLLAAHRVVALDLAGEERLVAAEHASRYRDTLGARLPRDLPRALRERAEDPAGDLVLRYARTHGPFTASDLLARFALGPREAEDVLRRLVAAGRLLEGAFRPGGSHREWCEPGVLQRLRRASLAKLRREAEPVAPPVFARFACAWHGITRRARGLDALLDAIERLQGAAVPASILESDVLPARVEGYARSDLDALAAAGEVVWCGIEALGDRDGRIALYLPDALPKLHAPEAPPGDLPAREASLLTALASRGASFFDALHEAAGGGFPRESVAALWRLVWRGLVTNDGFSALRAYLAPAGAARRRGTSRGRGFRSRRGAPPAAEGRWSLVDRSGSAPPTPTERLAALAGQLLSRHGIVSREVAAAEGIAGGFRPVAEVLSALEAAGRIRRGYFVAGVGATQFATPAALDLLRRLRGLPDTSGAVTLAAADPANPYGALLRWPEAAEGERGRPARTAGAHVVLVGGALAAFAGRGGRQIITWLPGDDADRARTRAALDHALAGLAASHERRSLVR